jgi:7-cyano-7-deazaguanine synthase in queuosine biosynthesis
MNILIKDVKIIIPDGPIGIKCSGGADSSLLLYILMSNTEAPIHIFSGAFKRKNRAVITVTPAVIDKCIELTGKTNIFQHIVFSEVENQDSLNDMAKTSLMKNEVTVLYSGVTSIPPDEVTENFLNKTASPEIYKSRNPNIKKSLLDDKLYRPFINIDKKKIKEMYQHLGILESLFPLTRSCESIKIFSGHCEQCWWCEERFWAFNRYN